GTKPEKLFEELHESGVLSERTWVLLMSCPGSWKELLQNDEISKQISQLSTWLFELQEVRKRRGVSVSQVREAESGNVQKSR
ncbi:MAG: hypothetical protein ACP5PX_07365, partial [Candidatus Hadarchaeum sp.]|uniref:hypothetical protein n=1 Tax=Candidatus Hadarchaeum sp. TaxID=2883567 RepID=UPI003D108C47